MSPFATEPPLIAHDQEVADTKDPPPIHPIPRERHHVVAEQMTHVVA
jgi:hypothetical protein